MRVVVGVSELVGQRIEEEVAAFSVQIQCQALEDIHGRRVHHWRRPWCRLQLCDGLCQQHCFFRPSISLSIYLRMEALGARD